MVVSNRRAGPATQSAPVVHANRGRTAGEAPKALEFVTFPESTDPAPDTALSCPPERHHAARQEVPQAAPSEQALLRPGGPAAQPAREVLADADGELDRHVERHGGLVRQQRGAGIAR